MMLYLCQTLWKCLIHLFKDVPLSDGLVRGWSYALSLRYITSSGIWKDVTRQDGTIKLVSLSL